MRAAAEGAGRPLPRRRRDGGGPGGPAPGAPRSSRRPRSPAATRATPAAAAGPRRRRARDVGARRAGDRRGRRWRLRGARARGGRRAARARRPCRSPSRRCATTTRRATARRTPTLRGLRHRRRPGDRLVHRALLRDAGLRRRGQDRGRAHPAPHRPGGGHRDGRQLAHPGRRRSRCSDRWWTAAARSWPRAPWRAATRSCRCSPRTPPRPTSSGSPRSCPTRRAAYSAGVGEVELRGTPNSS